MTSIRSTILLTAAVIAVVAQPVAGYSAAAGAGGRGGGQSSGSGGGSSAGGGTGAGGSHGGGDARDSVLLEVAPPRLPPPHRIIRSVSLKIHCRGGSIVTDDWTGIDHRTCRDWPE